MAFPGGKAFAICWGSSSMRAPSTDGGFSPNLGGTGDFPEAKESS